MPMNVSEKTRAAISSTIREALCRYVSGDENSVVTDIHLLPKQDSGELLIFNDDDEELARTIIEEWIECDTDDFMKEVESVLRSEIAALNDQRYFEKLSLLKPYSFVLVDEDRETVAELMLVDDDDTLLLNDELLKGLDEELDAFLKELLEK